MESLLHPPRRVPYPLLWPPLALVLSLWLGRLQGMGLCHGILRSDLMKNFPGWSGRQAVAFLHWLKEHGWWGQKRGLEAEEK